MGTDSPSLDYEALAETLAQSGAVIALAELHGGVCGALCAGGVVAAERWLADCLEDQHLPEASQKSVAPLHEMVVESWRMLDGRELGFTLLVPSDDAPLDEQVEGLGLWCHGFVGAVAVGSPAGELEEENLREILGDLTEISRAGLSEDEAEGHGSPDFALAEIQEYVRVGVQLVFEQLAARRVPRHGLN